MDSVTESQPLKVLNRVFGYSEFRRGQAEIIDTVLNGQDALVLMPTGGGKSICYQIPPLISNSLCVVVSPLIALMQDQVLALHQLGVNAATINSNSSTDEFSATMRAIEQGELRLLYISPERLVMDKTIELLKRVNPSLFAIDEAHCVSQWGHDFRPEYRMLSLIKNQFLDAPVMALTATADEVTRDDIVSQLGLKDCRIFSFGFDRPNIHYSISPKNSAKDQLLGFLSEFKGEAGIVYCLSRKKVDETAEWLNASRIPAVAYHAGKSASARQAAQRRFSTEDGLIVVATIAFGMGIDKSNVRFVAHLDLPKSIESYYQETGRAGRDGLSAKCLMLYSMADVAIHGQMLESSDLPLQQKLLEQRKRNALLGLCETAECRRQVLLRYFGENIDKPCGNCDNCNHPVETFDGTEPAQKILSTVYRTGSRFGSGHIVDVLIGKETDKVQRFCHQDLSVFGIGKAHERREWLSMIRQLVSAGLLDIDLAQYGSLRLTEKSRQVLKGELEIKFRVDKRKATKTKPPAVKLGRPELKGSATKLFEELRKLRLEIAKSKGMPPYVIFHDRTLVEMSNEQPTSLDSLGTISGVGQAKLSRYGEVFLRKIQEHVERG